jgi:hypothetical protein
MKNDELKKNLKITKPRLILEERVTYSMNKRMKNLKNDFVVKLNQHLLA